MTKEEIQQGYHDQCKVDINAPEHLQIPAYYTHDGWMQGAEWMQEQMINEACEWLCTELKRIEEKHYIHVHGFDDERREQFLEQFCKAMKGETE